MYIYKITNTINNKVYIGQTTLKYASQRWQVHKYDAKKKHKQYPLYRAMFKYGINKFKFEVIYVAKNLEELNEKEIEFIKIFNCLTPNGYNILHGGKNAKHTEETKKKIGLKSLGRKTFLGKKHSEETKQKISKIHKGKKLNPNSYKKLLKKFYLIDVNNNIIEVIGLKDFCRKNKYDVRSIQRLLSGKYKSYKGLKLYKPESSCHAAGNDAAIITSY